MDNSYKGVTELMVHEQFTNSFSKKGAVHLLKRNPKDFEELARVA